MINLALTLGYLEMMSLATGRAWSRSSATDNIISKLGYSCMNVDSRFSYKLASRHFRGRRIDTPGTAFGGAVASGDRGRRRYLLRLWYNKQGLGAPKK